jgi:prolyl-tRNA editing enzyme YbaK/EbsC (Cys-tRNA(Pro) deacylase)
MTGGFSIGGVPPVGHLNRLRTLVDTGLYELPELWAAAGTPNALFALTPDDLRRLVPEAVPVELRTARP